MPGLGGGKGERHATKDMQRQTCITLGRLDIEEEAVGQVKKDEKRIKREKSWCTERWKKVSQRYFIKMKCDFCSGLHRGYIWAVFTHVD